MYTIGAKDAREGFSAMLDKAQREPVLIEKKGRPVAVMLSHEDYMRLEALEDSYWIEKARRAEQEGYLGAEASEQFLSGILNAQD